jgi:hypothetical protein
MVGCPPQAKASLAASPPRPAFGPTQSLTIWVQGSVSSGIKRPEREADHSPRSVSRSRNSGVILVRYHGGVLNK